MSKIFKLLFIGLFLFSIVGFTPPTANYTPDAYDKLLIHGDQADGTAGTDIIDSATSKTITAVGDAQVDTAQYKNLTGSTGSILFDGTGDSLNVPDSTDFAFPADFTIDFWVRFNSVPTSDGQVQYLYAGAAGVISAYIYHTATDLKLYMYGEMNISAIWEASTNTWYHVALVRASGTITYYINGTSIGGGSNSTSIVSGVQHIGSDASNAQGLDGWIDEFRISKGIARDWAPADQGDVIIIQYVKSFINNLNPDKIGTPVWSCKIKLESFLRNLKG